MTGPSPGPGGTPSPGIRLGSKPSLASGQSELQEGPEWVERGVLQSAPPVPGALTIQGRCGQARGTGEYLRLDRRMKKGPLTQSYVKTCVDTNPHHSEDQQLPRRVLDGLGVQGRGSKCQPYLLPPPSQTSASKDPAVSSASFPGASAGDR